MPVASAIENLALNLAVDSGHTWMVLLKDNLEIERLSYGPTSPITLANRNDFLNGNISGTGNYPIGTSSGSEKIPIEDEQKGEAMKVAIQNFKATPPNYSPTSHCTNVITNLLQSQGIQPPDGRGDLIFKEGGIQLWSGYDQNPYHLGLLFGASPRPNPPPSTKKFK
jgi:hypothetical protein